MLRLPAAFVRTIYQRAFALLAESSVLASIGYSFNAHDLASSHPILLALVRYFPSSAKRTVKTYQSCIDFGVDIYKLALALQ